MISANQLTPARIPRRRALAAALLVGLALSGCNEIEPLEAIRQQQAGGDYKGSIEPLRELLVTRPDDAELNFLYGQALTLTGQTQLAVWSLRKALEDPEWLVAAGSQLALTELGNRSFDEVVKITGRILEREPDNVPILLMRANAYAHSKLNPALALADAKRVLEIDPDAVEAYEPRILALLDLQQLEEATEMLAEAGRRVTELGTSEEVLAWHCSTTAAFEQVGGDLEQARETWVACLDAHPTDLHVLADGTSFYDGLGEMDRSIEILRRAFASVPASRTIRIGLAERLRLMGEAAEAEAMLSEPTLAEEPLPAAEAWLDLSHFHQAQGEHGAAANAMERAVELARKADSLTPALQFEYVDSLLLAGQLDRTLEAAADLSVPAQRHLIFARVAQERRDPAGALKEFDEAFRLWPDNPWSRYYAALAAEELGDFERALAELRFAVRISPGATDARTRGAALLLATGQPSPALQMILAAQGQAAAMEIEGHLLTMRLYGVLGDTTAMADLLSKIEKLSPASAGQALAEAAEGLASRAGPANALGMLATAPNVNFNDPRYAPALRAIVRFSHEAGETAATEASLRTIFESNPNSSPIQEINAFDIELAGAPAEAVRAAYSRALELEPGNALALAGLGRLTVGDDLDAALAFFDRAAAADPSAPDPKLEAARTLVASGKLTQAAERLDALLLDHPFEAEAAAERARLDLELGVATPRTLERARRAVLFGGGADALELLSRVHAQLNEPEPAARAAERARALREAQASES